MRICEKCNRAIVQCECIKPAPAITPAPEPEIINDPFGLFGEPTAANFGAQSSLPVEAFTSNPFALFTAGGKKYESSQMSDALLQRTEAVEVPHFCKNCNKIWDYGCRFHMKDVLYKTVTTRRIKAEQSAPVSQIAASSPVTFTIRAATVLGLSSGVAVIPVPEKSKATFIGTKARTRDVMQIARWNDTNPNQNCGVCASYDEGGLWFLDDDLGTLAETLLRETENDISQYFSVKTADGAHYYFLHDEFSRAQRYGGNPNSQVIDTPGYKGEARCDNQYVMSPLSVHPTGHVYQIVNNVPIVPAPAWLLEWLKQKYALSESLKLESKNKKAKKHQKTTAAESKIYGPISKSDGTIAIYPDAPVAGFKTLAIAAGWGAFVRRMRDEGVEVTDDNFIPGAVFPCPMPGHKHKDYTPCFGIQKSNSELAKCLGNCGFNGDFIKAIYEIDGGAETYPTMYDAARAICEEENLRFEDYFPPAEKEELRGLAAAFSPEAMKKGREFVKIVEVETAAAVAKGLDPLTAANLAGGNAAAKIYKTPLRTMELIPMSASKPKHLKWLWPNRILENKGNVLFGEPGLGKGFVGADFVARMTTGRDFYDSPNNNELYSAIVCCDEDSWEETIQPRLLVAGADPDRVFKLFISNTSAESVEEGLMRLDTDLPQLAETIASNPDRKFIILVDPLATYVGELDPNKDKEVRPLYTKLKQFAEKYCVTFVFVAHPNKNEEASAINRLSGAKALTSVFRNTWLVEKDPEDKSARLLVSTKGNLAGENSKKGLRFKIENVADTGIIADDGETIKDIGKLEWTGVTDKDADEVLQAAASGGKNYKKKKDEQTGVDFLKDFLATGAQCAGDGYQEAARLDISEWFVKRAKAVLKVRFRKIQGTVYWALDDGALDAKKAEIEEAQKIIMGPAIGAGEVEKPPVDLDGKK